MSPKILLLELLISIIVINGDVLPTNYEYYTSGGISSGLSADQSYFILNGRNISVYSGAVHYFRLPRAYWRTTLRKLRATGLNTVETYVAWDMHEPQSGVYDFGDGGSEMEDFLHVEEFLQTAQEEDLFVILRPGPYICAEHTFGGFPSWLLRDRRVAFRSTEETYIGYVRRYFNVLLPILAKYQFTRGGPVIAFQVENEYGYSPNPHLEYIEELYKLFVDNGIVELPISADPLLGGLRGTLPNFYHALNFRDSPEEQFDTLLEWQPNKPAMSMEFWSGRQDFWSSDDRYYTNSIEFRDNFERILKYPASANIYMFYGGSNYAFYNGGAYTNSLIDNSGFEAVTTSYDYQAPLNEAGDYTDKYYYVKELIDQYSPIKTYTPEVPELIPRVAYPAVTIEKQISFNDIIKYNSPYLIESENVVAIEMLDINNQSGQTHGYIVYRKENVDLEENTLLKIEGHVCDTLMVLVDGVLVSPILETVGDLDKFGYWRLTDSMLVINKERRNNVTVDLVVEEWGRINGAGNLAQYNHSLKGIWQGDVYFNDEKISDWKIIPLEFKKDWTNSLENWSEKITSFGPSLYYADLQIRGEPRDTYLDMSNWYKGLVTVNGFALGKYCKLGPQLSLYLPAPFLKEGDNRIVIFEHFEAADELTFITDPIWGGSNSKDNIL